MMRAGLVAAIVIIVAMVCFVPQSVVAADESGVRAKPLLVLSGADSKVRQENYRRVMSSEEWKRVWLDHLGFKDDTIYRQTFEVDFERYMVVALFRGNVVNVASLRIESVTETDKTVEVRFEDIGYQTGETGIGKDRGKQATPYAFVILPKTEKPVVLKWNVQEYIGQPPVWKELTRLGDGTK